MNFKRKLFKFFLVLAVATTGLAFAALFGDFPATPPSANPSVSVLVTDYKPYLGREVAIVGRFEACPPLAEVIKGSRERAVCFLADLADSPQKVKVRFVKEFNEDELLNFGPYQVRGVVEATSNYWYGAQIAVSQVQRVNP